MKTILTKAYFVLALTLFIIPASVAQNSEIIENQSLKDQYDHMIEKSETYAEYKVIKTEKLNAFWQTAQDSLKMINDQKNDANTTINSQRYEIEDLTTTIAEKDELLQQGESEKANISVLGIVFNKTAYSFISLIIYCGLIVIIGLLYTKLKTNNSITKTAKQTLYDVEQQYEEHKKVALEKQMKLNRELQTERNKLMEVVH